MNPSKVRQPMLSALASIVMFATSMSASALPQTSPAAVSVDMRHATAFTIRQTTIGEGIPKLIVPTTGTTAQEILKQARAIGQNANADLIEFRIDYLNFATDATKVAALGKQVVKAIHGKPMILTFRTKAEGGPNPISDADYGKLYEALINAHFTDLLDVEMFRDPKVVSQIVSDAHKAGIKVVMSSHDFQSTPDTSEIVSRLRRQDQEGADVLKIATMPRSPADVVKLLDASVQIRQRYSTKPLLVMSMGGLGAITRLSGEVFGSDLTFGMIGVPSAPGQVDVKQMHDVLEVVHGALAGTK